MPLILCNNLTPGINVGSRQQFGRRCKTFVLELGFDHHWLHCQVRLVVLDLCFTGKKTPLFWSDLSKGTRVVSILGRTFLDLVFYDFSQ